MEKISSVVLKGLIVLAVVFAILAIPHLLKFTSQGVPESYTLIETDCKLITSPCRIQLSSNLEIEVESLAAEIVPLERFSIVVSVLPLGASNTDDGLKGLENLIVWFDGRDMDMGQHFMTPKASGSEFGKKGKQGIEFTGMIPVCTVDPDMEWRFVASFSYNDSSYMVHMDVPVSVHK